MSAYAKRTRGGCPLLGVAASRPFFRHFPRRDSARITKSNLIRLSRALMELLGFFLPAQVSANEKRPFCCIKRCRSPTHPVSESVQGIRRPQWG